MKLLIVTQTLDKNDPTLGFFHEWVRAFSEKFETVTVIALNVGMHTLPKNVYVHSLGKESGAGKELRIVRYVSLLYSLRNEYTHVFAHMNPEYVIGGGVLWRLLGKKIGFWYVHGAVTLRLRLAALLANRVFTASRESCRIKNTNVMVVGHGIDTELFAPKRIPHPPSIVSVGRFSPSKKLELLIDAMKLVRTQIPGSLGRLVGDVATPENESYAERVKEYAKMAGVSIEKPVLHSDVPAVLALSDIFFNASQTNSLDKAVLEAMACGVVPVTSNVAYKPMLSPLGLFVEENAEAFAKRAGEILTSVAVRNELGEKVREEVVKNHSSSRLMSVLQSVYESL
ncbi:glycosyltransferase family 4 protein [Patescibacteria group bacterium]|nr:glycosyltransferase family 4 protein [Patescibacteria group bacterium]